MKNDMKTAYVKIPFSRFRKTDISLERICRIAVHDFLEMNNYNIRYITNDITIDPIARQYCVAILFRV